jgi:hypothetical protein
MSTLLVRVLVTGYLCLINFIYKQNLSIFINNKVRLQLCLSVVTTWTNFIQNLQHTTPSHSLVRHNFFLYMEEVKCVLYAALHGTWSGHPIFPQGIFFKQDPWSASHMRFQLVDKLFRKLKYTGIRKKIVCYKNVNTWNSLTIKHWNTLTWEQ